MGSISMPIRLPHFRIPWDWGCRVEGSPRKPSSTNNICLYKISPLSRSAYPSPVITLLNTAAATFITFTEQRMGVFIRVSASYIRANLYSSRHPSGEALSFVELQRPAFVHARHRWEPHFGRCRPPCCGHWWPVEVRETRPSPSPIPGPHPPSGPQAPPCPACPWLMAHVSTTRALTR